MDYYGTWFVDSDIGYDWIGFVFGYQSNRKFYLVQWRHQNYNYGGTSYRGGIKGLQIKVCWQKLFNSVVVTYLVRL